MASSPPPPPLAPTPPLAPPPAATIATPPLVPLPPPPLTSTPTAAHATTLVTAPPAATSTTPPRAVTPTAAPSTAAATHTATPLVTSSVTVTTPPSIIPSLLSPSLGPKNKALSAPSSPDHGTSGFSEEKYKKLKRKLREIMEINESMNREYLRTKKKIRTLTFERNLLLDNIARMEGQSSEESNTDISEVSDFDSESEDVLVSASSKYPRTVRRVTTPHKDKRDPSSVVSSPTLSPTRHRDLATVASAPPKRSKISRIAVKTRRVQPIERDETGHPKLPQQIGVLTVLNLGKIVSDRDTFHNERYIFPVGYTVSRTYPSMSDPTSNTVITSTILDGGDGPRFHVVAADVPDQPIIANSATGAWTVVVRKSNEIRNREHSNSASGPDYYGFKHPTIAKMIQDLPGAEHLKHYVWQNFEEMEPRAAKGVMAAAEKKRGNLEQMGNANRRAPRLDGMNDDESMEEEQEDAPVIVTMADTELTMADDEFDDEEDFGQGYESTMVSVGVEDIEEEVDQLGSDED
ncbi:F/Y-rich N-terminus-domain-containing protein [Spinellus fusiger]|nr:F/Y-rich N-terminus-domain-containing protein [Spinellus fusiger]